MGHITAANSAYQKGLKLDPKNEEMEVGLELARRALERTGKHRREAMHE